MGSNLGEAQSGRWRSDGLRPRVRGIGSGVDRSRTRTFRRQKFGRYVDEQETFGIYAQINGTRK